MKLELKHLAPYLPYELNVIALKKRYHNFGGVTTEQKNFIIDSLKVNYLSVVGYSGMYLHDDFKPILRPLSDLTKKIEFKGEAFIPIVELYWHSRAQGTRYSENYEYLKTWEGMPILRHQSDDCYFEFCVIGTEFHLKHIDIKKKKSSIFSIENQIYLFQLLFEWHFDVYGLIEAGLAVNMNDLN